MSDAPRPILDDTLASQASLRFANWLAFQIIEPEYIEAMYLFCWTHLRCIQEFLKFAERLNKLVRPTELAGYLRQISVLRDWRHLEHVGDRELGHAVFGIFVQQFIDDGSCLGAELIEEVLLVPPKLSLPAASWSEAER